MSKQSPPKLASLHPSEVVKLLRTAGSVAISNERLERDIAAGLPTNSDGTINLVTYGAWLIRTIAQGERGHG